MRIAAVVALFVLAFAAVLLGVVAPASGQTIPPIPTYEYATPETPYPTETPRPECSHDWCMPGPTPAPNVPPPNVPPLEPTAEVEPAFPGMPLEVGWLVFCPKVGRDGR
jgi:hypothetical protein